MPIKEGQLLKSSKRVDTPLVAKPEPVELIPKPIDNPISKVENNTSLSSAALENDLLTLKDLLDETIETVEELLIDADTLGNPFILDAISEFIGEVRFGVEDSISTLIDNPEIAQTEEATRLNRFLSDDYDD
jgi:hypothetical protein